MKHHKPPENLPVAPRRTELPGELTAESESTEDVHFRDRRTRDIVEATPADVATKRGESVSAPRSLQPIRLSMSESKERPIRPPDDLLDVNGVAERLLISRAAVYRLVKNRHLPFYRLPAGIRFKVADVDTFLDGRRAEARSPKSYGSAQGQR